jgi:hypothetical protein
MDSIVPTTICDYQARGDALINIENDNPSSDNTNELSSQEPTSSSNNPSSDAAQIIKPVLSWHTLITDSVILSVISLMFLNK